MTKRKKDILKQIGILAVELIIIALYVVFSFCVLWNMNPLESVPEEKAKGEYCASSSVQSLSASVDELQPFADDFGGITYFDLKSLVNPFYLSGSLVLTSSSKWLVFRNPPNAVVTFIFRPVISDYHIGLRPARNNVPCGPDILFSAENNYVTYDFSEYSLDAVEIFLSTTGESKRITFELFIYQGEYSPGFWQGYNLGFENGKTEGYKDGYSQGVQDTTDEFTLLSNFIPANLSFPFPDSVNGSISLDNTLPGRPLSAKWIYNAGVAPGSYQSSLSFLLDSPLVSGNLYRLEYSSTKDLQLSSGVGFPDRAISSAIATLPAGTNTFVTFYAPRYYDGVDLVKAFSSLYFVPLSREQVILYDVKLYIVSETGSAYDKGYADGNKAGFAEGDKASYQRGYSTGYSEAIKISSKGDFFSLISAVVDAPVTVFSSLLDFEILGFNMRSVVLSLLTAALIMAAIRLFSGGKT